MPSASDRTDFAPPSAKGSIRAFGLALFVHLLLIAALTWGINWKTQDDAASSFAAELWTSTPQEAVPRQPVPQPVAPPPAPTPVTPPKAVETPETPDVDIALAQEKKRKEEREKKLALEQAQKEKARLRAEADAAEKAEAQAERLAKAEKAKADARKAQQAKELQAAKDAKEAKDADKAEAANAQAKAAKDAETKQANAKAAEKQRQDNLKRMAGQIGATGTSDGNSTSNASSGGRGTSNTYGAIVRAAIRPNVVFTEDIVGNPMAKVEVRLTLDGTVISQRLVQSSGNKAWDQAAVNAIIRTRVMPRDVDGRIPDTTLILEMRPRG